MAGGEGSDKGEVVEEEAEVEDCLMSLRRLLRAMVGFLIVIDDSLSGFEGFADGVHAFDGHLS